VLPESVSVIMLVVEIWAAELQVTDLLQRALKESE